LIRLGDNRSQRSSISWVRYLNGGSVSGEELAGDATCSDSWHPYVAVGLTYQLPARPLGRHDTSGHVDSAILPLALSLARSSSSPRLRRCFGELARSCLGISGRATPPSAPPASPLHRHRVGYGCRASVSPHCLLRRELTSPELRRGHRCRGQGSVVHHFFSFLFQKLRLVMLVLVGILFCPVTDQRRRRLAAHHRRAAIREGKVPRVR